MNGKIAFVLAIAVAVASGKPNTRIIGGEEAQPNEFPFLVEIQRNNAHFCSGSIISDEWIVTAAHCATGRASDYKIVAGDHDLSAEEGSEQTRQVVRVVKHALYDSDQAFDFEYDIAIMQVLPPFQLNDQVQVANLPMSGFAPSADGVIIGWGATSEQGEASSVLRKASIPLVSDDACDAAYGGDAVTERMICAGGNGVDFCTGDSGGPLLCSDDSNSDVLCGLMSWGLGCGRPGFPGVYTETSYFDQWLVDAVLPEPEDNSTYVEQTEGCGGNLVGSSGKIEYKFSSNHTTNERCTWSVRANLRETVRVTLGENSGFGENVYLEITEVDFGSGKTTRMSRVDPENSVVLVPGPMILITLVSDSSDNGGEFSLLFQGLGDQGSVDVQLRHYHLGNETASFSYPVGGGEYGNDELTTFVVNPPTGAISMRFDRLDLESGSCTYDVINIHTHTAAGGFNSVSSICGTNPPATPFVSDGVILLIMKTDFSITGSGFTISWM